jgi:hypothetical protein
MSDINSHEDMNELEDHNWQKIQAELAQTRNLLLEATRNLGHPAYGLSSGTTIAIDELREKCFGFLGIESRIDSTDK